MNQRQQINVDLKEGTEYKCPKCGRKVYNVVFKITKISSLAKSNPTGRDIMIPQSHFACAKCKYILKDARPG